MVTPMKRDGSVDYEQAAALARYLVENGSDGVVVSGTTGESPTLTTDEKLRLFEAVLRGVDGKGRVLAGTGSYSTADSVRLSQAAARLGVDGLMLVVPYYNKPPQEGLKRHFEEIAAATDLPLMLYNIPGRTGVNLLPETIARLVESIGTLKAIKEASGSLDQVTQLRRLCPGLAVYSGDDALTLPVLSVGGHGVVSVAGHLVGPSLRQMIDAFFAGRHAEAAEIHVRLQPLFRMLFITTNPIPVKVAMRLAGFDVGPLRLPLCEPSEAERQRIEQVLHEYGLLPSSAAHNG